jgi:hypothetical protein
MRIGSRPLRILHTLPVVVALAVAISIGTRLLWINNPGFFMWEMSGISYDMSFENLCSERLLAGLDGPTDNAAEQRYSSALYMVPTKLLYNVYDPYTVHRSVALSLYALFCLLSAFCVYAWWHSLPLAVLFVSYLTTHPLVVSNLFQHKLVVASLVWCALSVLFITMLERVRVQKVSETPPRELRIYWLLALTPFMIILGYESYAGTRVLAVGWWLLLFMYSLTRGTRSIFLYLCSTGLSGLLLKMLHPLMEFNLGVFSGRGEGPFERSSGKPQGQIWTWFLDRISESAQYISWPRAIIDFDSEHIGSHLDQAIALAVLACIAAFSCLSSARFRATVWRARWAFFLLGSLLIGSFLIPLFSNTGIRAHRQFGIYVYLTALIYLFAVLIAQEFRLLSRLINVLAVVACFYILPPRIQALSTIWEHQVYLREKAVFLRLSEHAVDLKRANIQIPNILICETDSIQLGHTHWTSILYSSRLPCVIGAQNLKMGCSVDGMNGAILKITRSDAEVHLERL